MVIRGNKSAISPSNKRNKRDREKVKEKCSDSLRFYG